jgi:hypothetical protein
MTGLKESVDKAVLDWFDSNVVKFTDYWNAEEYIKELEQHIHKIFPNLSTDEVLMEVLKFMRGKT